MPVDPESLRNWMRIPYAEGGRSKVGADCWGLVRIVREAVRGDTLPLYATVDAVHKADMAAAMADFEAAAFRVVEPMDGAIAFVVGPTGAWDHSGIVLTIDGRRSVLDTLAGHGPRHQPQRYFERCYRDVRYYDR